MSEAYPLAWPTGWPRTDAARRKRAKFNKGERVYSQNGGGSWMSRKELTISEATKRVISELRALGVRDGGWVISSNLELRNDGLPRSSQRAPNDPGIAVYWTRAGKEQKVMAVDAYDRIADNLAAIAATLNAMRAIERHGGAQILERAFTGFDALPAPGARDPFAILGLKIGASALDVQSAFRSLSKRHHPDVASCSTIAFQDIQWARDEALKRAAP
jgi:hypothetical protein